MFSAPSKLPPIDVSITTGSIGSTKVPALFTRSSSELHPTARLASNEHKIILFYVVFILSYSVFHQSLFPSYFKVTKF